MKTKLLSILLVLLMMVSVFALSACNMEGVEGPQGPQGEQGEPGEDGVGIRGISLVRSTGLVDTYLITYTDGSTSTFTVTNGANGADGKDGVNGEDGKDGLDGTPGQDGEDGTDGKDGIGIASAEVNADGELVLHFTNGSALNLGKVVGSNGKDGADGEDGKDGADGTNGTDGKDGQDGADGKDGVGIADVAIVEDRLVLTLSNGTVIDLGNIKGEDGKDGSDGEDGKDGVNGTDGKDGINGKDGISIVKSEINANGELVLTYSDGNSTNLGKVVGTNGKDGADGEDGKDGVDGVGISTVVINEKHELVITLSNGTVINLGNIKGEKGDKGDKGETGEQGPQGDKGETGATGVGIEKVEFDENGDLVITFTDGTTQTVEMPEKSEHTHTYGAWLVYGEATDNCENNIYYVVCSECNHVDFKKGDADRHVWNGWYSSDSSYHWFGCANCEEIKEHTAHVYDNDCDVDCNVCGADRTAFAHVYDSDVCDVDCNVCGAVRVDPHVWDSACDAECDRCGEVREVPDHVYDNACDANCNVCGGARVPANHVYDDEFDAVCNVCGERREVPYTWGLEYALNPDETGYMVIGLGEATDTVIIIPETHNGLPVTMIRGRAFYERDNITSVTIPDSVTAIGGYAFYDCGRLTSVEIGDGVTTIGERAFASCGRLTSVVISDSVTSIGGHAFFGCSSLTSVVIGDSVTSIGQYAFWNCTSLTSVVIGDSVTSIGQYAFLDCTSLTSVEIGSGASDIDSNAFRGCTALTSITVDEDNATYKSIDGNLYSKDGKTLVRYAIGKTSASFIVPKDVEAIYSYAFENAPNLVRIIFQDNLKTIRGEAFYSCYSLMEVCYTKGKAEWDNVNISSNYNDAIKNASFTFNYCIHEYSGDCDVDCNKCGKERVALVEHTVVVDEAVAATCTETGLTEGSHCSVCTQVLVEQVVVDALGHNYVDGTCTMCEKKFFSEGLMYKLNDDGESYTVLGLGECTDTDIIIPETHEGKPVTIIGIQAFRSVKLTSIIMPDYITTIKSMAFMWCTSLTDITIPKNVTVIEQGALAGCTSLTSFHVAEGNTAFKTIDGNVYTFDGKTLVAYALAKPETEFIVPDGVELIGRTAFGGGTALQTIVLPESLTAIGQSAFYGNENLKSIIIPIGVTEMEAAFSGCTDMTIYCEAESQLDGWQSDWNNSNCVYYYSKTQPTTEGNFWHWVDGEVVVWPDYVEPELIPTPDEYFEFTLLEDGTYSIKAKDVNNMPSDVVIPSTYDGKQITTIDEKAFYHCNNIRSVEIPNSVITIGAEAFTYCNKLISVVIPNSVTTIGYGAFRQCDKLASVEIGDGVTSIGHEVFYYCSNLTSVVIGDSVTSIGKGTFAYCNLDTIVCNSQNYYIESGCLIENGTKVIAGTNGSIIPEGIILIDDYALSGRKQLINIIIPNGVTTIGNYAFTVCSKLQNVEIPDSVTNIGDNAFAACSKLTSVVTGDGLTTIGDYAFKDCSSLTSVVIPDSVTSIGDFAFRGCSSLTSVVIGDSVTSISFQAFKDCSSLTSVVIPDSVASISSDAFLSCSSLANVVISDNVTSIGDKAFYGTAYYENENNWVDGVLYIGNHLIEGKYTIPSEYIIKDGIVTIADSAFESSSNLTSVVIPNSVTSIGNNAFYWCRKLAKVYYTNTKVEWEKISIGISNSDLTSTTRYYYSETHPTTAGNFWHWVDGKPTVWCYDVAIDEAVEATCTETGLTEGSHCSVCGEVLVAQEVVEIDESNHNYVDGNCEYCGLTSDEHFTFTLLENDTYSIKAKDVNNMPANVVIPGTHNGKAVTVIGFRAFYDCTSLASVKIGNSVRIIGEGAFSYCSRLTSIVIPDSVTSIGNDAFWDCDSLSRVVIPDSVTSIGNYAFSYCTNLTKVHYTGTKEQWAAISIDDYNSSFTNVTIHYNYVPEE